MKKLTFYNIAKILFIFLCTLFLLTACGDSKDGGTFVDYENDEGMGEDELGDIHQTCWQSSLLSVFYENLGSATLIVYNKLTSENLRNVMMLAFTVWMAFQILRHVATTSPESIGEFWTKIIRKAFLCSVCGFLVTNTDNIYYVVNTFIMPIYVTLLQFASNILAILAEDPDASSSGIMIKDGSEGWCEGYNNSLNNADCQLPSTALKFENGKFPDAPLKMMGCMTCALSDRLNFGFRIAFKLMSQVSIVAFLVGCFLIAAFLIAKICFVFYLVDSIFRLNMMMIILPFLIMFYPFEQTRKWSITGLKFILNSSAIMLCLAVLVGMSVFAMQKILVDPAMGMNFADTDEYTNLGTVALSLILMGFLIVKATSLAVDLSDSITGGKGDTSFQKKVAALVGTIAKAALSYFTAGVGKVVVQVAEHSERVRKALEKAQKAKAKIAKVRAKMDHLAGRQ
jgi:hypothetical protein